MTSVLSGVDIDTNDEGVWVTVDYCGVTRILGAKMTSAISDSYLRGIATSFAYSPSSSKAYSKRILKYTWGRATL